MKYIIDTENFLCERFSFLLIEELKRFDIRADIKEARKSQIEFRRQLRDENPDLYILIGSQFSKKRLTKAKSMNLRTCFFHQSLMDNPHNRIKYSFADIVYRDLPDAEKPVMHTFFASDILRKQSSIHGTEDLSHSVSILYNGRRKEKLAQKIAARLKEASKVNFHISDLSGDLDNATDDTRRSNAAITLDQFSHLFSIYSNCPSVYVYERSMFRKVSEPVSNRWLSGDDKIKTFGHADYESIAEEMNRILNDHEYCAALLDSFQQVKSEIGLKPFSREAAKEIVEWLEENGN